MKGSILDPLSAGRGRKQEAASEVHRRPGTGRGTDDGTAARIATAAARRARGAVCRLRRAHRRDRYTNR
jgi:hypothetical protein